MPVTSPVRVAVNGFGVIGKRVADAVAQQDDTMLAGVADVVSDYRMHVAEECGFPVFAGSSVNLGALLTSGAGRCQQVPKFPLMPRDGLPSSRQAQRRGCLSH